MAAEMPTPAGATPGAEVWEGVVIFTGVMWTAYNMAPNLILPTIIVFIGAFSLQSTWPKCSVDQTLGWNLRPGAGSGLVTGSILIPMVLVANNLHGNAKEYGVSGMFCAYSLCMSHAAVCLVWLSKSDLHPDRPSIRTMGTIATTISVFLILLLQDLPLGIGNFTIGILGVVFCLCVLHGLLTSLPSSLSLGEAMIASEGVALLMIDSCQNVFYRNRSLEYELLQSVALGLAIIGVASALMFVTNDKTGKQSTASWKDSLRFYILVLSVVVLICVPHLWWLLGRIPILWLMGFILACDSSISLIGYWSVMTLVAIATVARQNRTNPAGAGSTIVRKYFHLIAIAVFLPGLMRNPQLLYIGSVAALGAFILLEYVRMYRIQPFGESLHTSLRVFVDEKDRGVAILTHIYLLLGCSLPLWLYPSAYTIGTELAMYSGVISLGVGDTAASVIGSKLGRHRWPGTKKTVEGTLAAVVAQLAACCTLSLLGIQPGFTANLIPIVTAVCLTSLLEAFTSQVDNIVTPLYMYALFSSGLSS
ncbi:dolichol kinase-like [Branchiostoma floridae]|uniref:dolichol kinase n=1 Tax=Branchiostoma floridae TaxID=7739 RepID=A0A9J7MEQ9_BRAFL|nr:dolichol kinase-like [Branchiostoma floridae]